MKLKDGGIDLQSRDNAWNRPSASRVVLGPTVDWIRELGLSDVDAEQERQIF